ncbi:dystroglycan-related [Anaeramoeba flamelloides]|uniref:Dystroglycan-related n=1 Tax=Anaeramoeba flamelloides TaxID=1746091 RepID=A0ABQ8ZDX6_9EUKA|nr:dystroglycan-related [Anaeramoeba flamelloides]
MSIGCTKKSYTSDGAISKTVTSSNDTPNYIRSTYLPNNFFVTVMESGSPKSILVELYNSDSVLETSKTNSQTSYSATRPDVLGFVNSEVLVVYSSAISTVVTRAQIYGEVFHTDMDLKISVTRLTQQDNCIYTVPLVKKFQNDSFVLIASGYKSGHARKVYGRILEANFTSIYPLTDEFEVTGEEHSVYYYDLALCGDESFVVAWSEPTDEYDAIYAKRYSRNGDLLIDKTQMYVFNNGDSIEPSATCSDDNMISLSWRTYNRDVVNTYVVYAQVFDSDFDAFGDSFRVDYSPEYGSDQKAPMVASYGNRLAVSYQESLWYYYTLYKIYTKPSENNKIPDQDFSLTSHKYSYTCPWDTFVVPYTDTMTYSAEFGDAAGWLTYHASNRSFEGVPPYTYSVVYSNIKEIVSDSCGNTADSQFQVTVVNQDPIVDQGLQTQYVEIPQGLNYQFDSNTFQDPEEQSLTYTENVNGQTWINFDGITRTFTGNPPNSCGEIYSGIEVIAADDCGNTVTDSFTIETTNQAPIVDSPLQDQTIYISGEGLDYQFSSNTFKDPEEQNMTYTENVNGHSWINFDGITRTFMGNPPHSCGEIFSGIEVTAEDDCGNTVTDSFTIEVTNQAPIVDSLLQDQTIYINGEGLNYQFGSNTFKDPEEQSLTYTENLNGHSWINFDQITLTFTGNRPYSCGEIFYGIEVTAQDDCGNTITDSFTIEVINQAPIVDSPLQDQTIYINGEGLDYQFGSNTFKDPEEQSLTYTENVNGHSWINFDDTTLTFTGNPPHSCTEIFSGIEVTAEDDCGNTITDSFTIEVTNQAPIIDSPLQDQTIYINGEGLDYQFSSNTFQDPEEKSLTYTENVNGHSWINFDDITRTFTGNPPHSCGEIYLGIEVTAEDDCGNTVTDSFTIETTNQVPKNQISLVDQSIDLDQNENLFYQFDEDSFQDPEGKPLDYSAYLSNNSPLPDWINFNETSRTFEGEPLPNQCQEDLEIKVIVKDDCLQKNFQLFKVSLFKKGTEKKKNLNDHQAEAGKQLNYVFDSDTFSDPFNQGLTYSATLENDELLPSWMNFDSDARQFTGVAEGCSQTLKIKVTAKDDCQNTDFAFFSLHIQNLDPSINEDISDASYPTSTAFEFSIKSDTFLDPENGVLTYSANEYNLETLPEWLNFDNKKLSFFGNCPNTAQNIWITVIAKDECNQENHLNFKFEIRNDNNNDDVDDDDTKTNNDDEDGNNTSTQTVIFSVALCIMFLIIVLFIINIWLKKVNKKKEHLKRNDKENVKDLEMKNYHDNYLNKSNDKKDRKSQQTFDSNSNSVGSSSSNSSSSSSSSSSSDEESD